MRRKDRIKKTIPVRREYLNKKACLREAKHLQQEGSLRHMKKKQIAQEIYFHAALYYFCKKTGRFSFFRERAGVIDLHDGGDTPVRRTAYLVCWFLKSGKRVKQVKPVKSGKRVKRRKGGERG